MVELRRRRSLVRAAHLAERHRKVADLQHHQTVEHVQRRRTRDRQIDIRRQRTEVRRIERVQRRIEVQPRIVEVAPVELVVGATHPIQYRIDIVTAERDLIRQANRAAVEVIERDSEIARVIGRGSRSSSILDTHDCQRADGRPEPDCAVLDGIVAVVVRRAGVVQTAADPDEHVHAREHQRERIGVMARAAGQVGAADLARRKFERSFDDHRAGNVDRRRAGDIQQAAVLAFEVDRRPDRRNHGDAIHSVIRTIVEIEDAARIGRVAGLVELDIEGPSVQRQVRNSNHARCAA